MNKVDPGWASADFVKGLVSVCVPTYNRSELVKESLMSVVHQEYRPIELIVVDDGSEDDTYEVLKQFEHSLSRDDFFIQILRQENSGAQIARTKCFVNSTGEFIQYLDSDDILYPAKISNQVAALNNDLTIDFSYAKARAVDHNGKFINTSGEPIAKGEKAKLSLSLWATESPLYRRHVCHTVGPWDFDIKGNQEVVYATRVKLNEFKPHFSEEIYSDRIVHQGPSISRNKLLPHIRACEAAGIRIFELFEQFGISNKNEWDALSVRFLMFAWQYSKLDQKTDSQRCLSKGMSIAKPLSKPMFMCLYLLQATFGTNALRLVKKLTNSLQGKLKYQLTPQKTDENN